MPLCELCAKLPEKLDKLPSNAATAHLSNEKRVGDSSPHFPKKYLRECPQCGAKWGTLYTSAWDSKWMLVSGQE